ncbi:ABC transporter permease [Kitasatospora sp. NBC_00374]|uniref:ABC transporter permease n=1 Tax=Kitasatospora sp. NBC_00374 TaxID=2975964 RepID=UPI0030DE77DF
MTQTLLHQLRIVRYAAVAAAAEYRHTHNWRTWTFGWLGRMLSQVTFFALIGRLLGSEEQVRYLVIGNAVMVCVLETMTVVSAGVRERYDGTLALLAAAPTPMSTVLFGRGLYAPLGGALTSAVSLFLLAPVFGVHTAPAELPVLALLILATALSTYGFGLLLGSLAIGLPGSRNVISTCCNLLAMAITGVQVPVSFWPPWIQAIASALPLTHALTAVRAVVAHDTPATVAHAVALTLLTGLLWLTIACLATAAIRRRGRRKGSFDYAA